MLRSEGNIIKCVGGTGKNFTLQKFIDKGTKGCVCDVKGSLLSKKGKWVREKVENTHAMIELIRSPKIQRQFIMSVGFSLQISYVYALFLFDVNH
jgi:hypothetical protein